MLVSYFEAGKITLPSTVLQFFDLGGQSGIRSIWSRYYDDCHAVVYVLDAADRARLNEGWEVFGAPRRSFFRPFSSNQLTNIISTVNCVLIFNGDGDA